MFPFRVAFDEAAIADLRDRLRRTRWPEKETVDDWSQGVPVAYARELCEYWAEAYDFVAAEARLNAFPQFRTTLLGGGGDELSIHFLHVLSPEPDAFPLVLTHGWPGSTVEFLKVIGPLSNPVGYGGDPRDAFDLVVPSLPGYGFSDKPSVRGWNAERIARAWDELMVRLGYDRYGAQGGDWGVLITTLLGEQAKDRVAGIHINGAVVALDQSSMDDLTPAEEAALARVAEHAEWGRGYSVLQSTRPQTLGYGLTDSPAGQCTWIAEKFCAWTDCDGHPEQALTKEEMLDNISVYWFTETAASSARMYWESLRNPSMGEVAVPSGISVFPHEIFRVSRRWAETRFTDLRWFNELNEGGHFAAFEQPELFVDEVRSFFRQVR
jgi:epoxide hydrolase